MTDLITRTPDERSTAIAEVRAHLPLPGMGQGRELDVEKVDGKAPARVVDRFLVGSVWHSRTSALVHDAGDIAFYHFETDTAHSFPRRRFPSTPSAPDPITD